MFLKLHSQNIQDYIDGACNQEQVKQVYKLIKNYKGFSAHGNAYGKSNLPTIILRISAQSLKATKF